MFFYLSEVCCVHHEISSNNSGIQEEQQLALICLGKAYVGPKRGTQTKDGDNDDELGLII